MEIISRLSARRHVIKWRRENKRREEVMSRSCVGSSVQTQKDTKKRRRERKKEKILREIFNYSQFIRVHFSSSSSSTPRHGHNNEKKWEIFLHFIPSLRHWWWITQITRGSHCSMPRRRTRLSARILCWFSLCCVQCFVNNCHRELGCTNTMLGMMEMTLFVQV